MTRKEIETEYAVRDGIIRSPGQFEGQPVHAVYFWAAYLDGMSDSDDGTTIRFRVDDDDRKEFPTLKGIRWVRLRQTDQGFIECW